MPKATLVPCPDCGACGPVGYPEEYDHYDSDAVQKAEEEAKAKALDLWANIKPRALRWTHEPPKVAGWYWMRQQGESFDLIQHYNQADIDGGFDNERRLKQWAGPIPAPID